MGRAAAALLLTLLGCCAGWSAPAAVMAIDDAGRRLVLERPPRRIVSLAPGITEMLFAAGAGERVVATVEHSHDPPAARRIPRIGDAHAIDLERLLALRPDVVVVWAGGNNPAQIASIERLGIPVYRQQVGTLVELPRSLRRLGVLTGTAAVAQAAADGLEERLGALTRRYAAEQRPVSVLLQVWNRPIYTVGGAQSMSDSLRVCGARNVFADLTELGPAVTLEAVIARDPEMIIALGPADVAAAWLDEWRRFGGLRAVRSGRLVAFDDQRLGRMGPSAVEATAALCRAIAAARR